MFIQTDGEYEMKFEWFMTFGDLALLCYYLGLTIPQIRILVNIPMTNND